MEKIESSIQNSPINASSDSVSVITMAPVATMASVSTLEKTAPELDSRHEISATTDMEATSIIEHKYLSENVGLLKEEPVKKRRSRAVFKRNSRRNSREGKSFKACSCVSKADR